MSAWSELGIECTNDVRAIKRAYAKRLKVTRPDEDKAAFQALHEAYQWALGWAEYNSDLPSGKESELTSPDSTSEVSNESHAQSLNSTQKPDASLEQLEMLEIVDDSASEAPTEHVIPVISTEDLIKDEQLTEQPQSAVLIEAEVENTSEQSFVKDHLPNEPFFTEQEVTQFRDRLLNAFTESPTTNDLSAFSELFQHPILSDYDHRNWLSYEVFYAVEQLSVQRKEDSDDVLLNGAAVSNAWLIRFNQIFDWLSQRNSLEYNFSLDGVDYLLDRIEQAKYHASTVVNTSEYTTVDNLSLIDRKMYLVYRCLAYALDVLILFFATIAFADTKGQQLKALLPNEIVPHADVLSFLLYYIVYFSLLEGFDATNTVGKRVLKLKVTNQYGEALSIPHAFWRTIVTLTCGLFFKLTAWANLIFFNNRLIQDYLSSSFVLVKRRPID